MKMSMVVREMDDPDLLALFHTLYNPQLTLSQKVATDYLHQWTLVRDLPGDAGTGNTGPTAPGGPRPGRGESKDDTTVLDLISPSALQYEPTFIRIGDQFGPVLNIIDYPYKVEGNWLASLFRYSANLATAVHLNLAPTDQMVRDLGNSLGEIERKLLSHPPARLRQSLGARLEDARTLLRKLDVEQQNAFFSCMYLMVTAPSLEELDRETRRLEAVVGGKQMRSRRATFAQDQGFTSVLPIALNAQFR